MGGPGRFVGNLGDDGGDDGFGGVGVAMEVGQDHFQRYVFVFFPAVVVGGHGEGGIGNLGFAGAFGFAEVGHADDVVAGSMVGAGFGAGAEGGAFHADVGAAVVDAGLGGAGGLDDDLPEFAAEGFGKGDVGDDAAAEKGVLEGLFGAVDELVDDDDVAGAVFFLQGADGADAEDPLDAEFFQGPDVGAVVEFGGQDAVAAAVAGEEDDVAPDEAAGQEIIGGGAEGGFDLDPFLVGEAFDAIEAGSADDANAMLCHAGFYIIVSGKSHVLGFGSWNCFNAF